MSEQDDSRKRKRQRRKNRKNKQQLPQRGYYADPLSPISSTPMKHQLAKTAEYSVCKTKNAPSSTSYNASGRQVATEKKLLSPRILLKVSDQDESRKRARKPRSLSYDSTSSSNSILEEKSKVDVDTSTDKNAKDELFSPALKPPKSSRSSSASPTKSVAAQSDEIVEQAAKEEDNLSYCCVDVEDEEGKVVTYSEQEFNPFFFMKTLPKYEDIVDRKRPISLPVRSRHSPKICLVLDLDETLVHCSVDEVKDAHTKFPVTFNGVEYIVNVKKRPHMEYFLKRVSKLFEIVVFTASHKAYAEKLMNLLDPHSNLINYRLYRDDCLDVFGNYLKDLNVLGRDLSKVVLVDNSPHAFGYQVNNGIPIETWYNDEADAELLNLLPFLESLVDVDDVRPIVERQFQIQKLIDATPEDTF